METGDELLLTGGAIFLTLNYKVKLNQFTRQVKGIISL